MEDFGRMEMGFNGKGEAAATHPEVRLGYWRSPQPAY